MLGEDFRPNCRRVEINGVKYVVCEPEEVQKNLRIPKGELKFRELSDGKTLEFVEMKDVDEKTIERVKNHLEENLGFKVVL